MVGGNARAIARRDDRCHASVFGGGAQVLAVIAFIADEEVGVVFAGQDQRFGDGGVMAVSARQFETSYASFIVGDGVDFRGASAARNADGFFFGALLGREPPFSAPAAARCALMLVESIISTLAGKRACTSWKIVCQIPCLAQRLKRL